MLFVREVLLQKLSLDQASLKKAQYFKRGNDQFKI